MFVRYSKNLGSVANFNAEVIVLDLPEVRVSIPAWVKLTFHLPSYFRNKLSIKGAMVAPAIDVRLTKDLGRSQKARPSGYWASMAPDGAACHKIPPMEFRCAFRCGTNKTVDGARAGVKSCNPLMQLSFRLWRGRGARANGVCRSRKRDPKCRPPGDSGQSVGRPIHVRVSTVLASRRGHVSHICCEQFPMSLSYVILGIEGARRLMAHRTPRDRSESFSIRLSEFQVGRRGVNALAANCGMGGLEWRLV